MWCPRQPSRGRAKSPERLERLPQVPAFRSRKLAVVKQLSKEWPRFVEAKLLLPLGHERMRFAQPFAPSTLQTMNEGSTWRVPSSDGACPFLVNPC